MTTRSNSANRTGLTLIGLVLLTAGVGGLLLSAGVFGPDPVSSPVLPEEVRTFAGDTPWFWWAAAAACLLLALLGARWLIAQLRTDRSGQMDLTADPGDGLTHLHAGALTTAVEDEAATIRGITGAAAHLVDRRGQRLQLVVDVADYADITDIRTGLEEQVVPHLRQALDTDLPVDIELRPGRSGRSGRGLT
ncbi:alkaline shock response membrane anchor protein AmaP [Cellulomonas fimi]|uniref:Alkaline shock response membrane anchor protein AmaP n=1 Tax=Cellulomonas fimi TaxID=1708 RepID=A0A7Y0M0A6_CELFI|nr:alkaline shock response membrane anchor protein AmaP [Cellulomonas fimi]NMR20077.1 alkaline shock response membrane anchor protein AmaP [Cellulomonas fimi]